MLMKNCEISYILYTQRWIDLLFEFVRKCLFVCAVLYCIIQGRATNTYKAECTVRLQDKYESVHMSYFAFFHTYTGSFEWRSAVILTTMATCSVLSIK